ncbi:TetR family transcriptional regulator C-terminal domain-containing protein [Streptomyces sp. NPDC001544]|uniref:TetR family transcriptional regulator C-terminal domain-containing protein n=1 Tax=Streptomyces sp. NPDC001544 TaxID=3364584 RepID=UPI003679B801
MRTVSEDVQDGRLLRGLRSRRTIVRHAVDTASLEGLDGLSFGRLATDLNVGKSSVQTLFATKEKLQLAVIEAAREAFEEAVIRPALARPRGAERLRALVEHWLAYAEQPLFPGGCFWAANLPEFDSRPGPVRDMLAGQQRAWRDRIAAELRHAVDDAGTSADLDADLTAFQIDAVLTAANTAMRLGDDTAAAKVRRVVDSLLAPLAAPG